MTADCTQIRCSIVLDTPIGSKMDLFKFQEKYSVALMCPNI